MISKIVINLPEEVYSPFHTAILDRPPFELTRLFEGEELKIRVELHVMDKRVYKIEHTVSLDGEGSWDSFIVDVCILSSLKEKPFLLTTFKK